MCCTVVFGLALGTSQTSAAIAFLDVAHHWHLDGTIADLVGSVDGELFGAAVIGSNRAAGSGALDTRPIQPGGSGLQITPAAETLQSPSFTVAGWINPRTFGEFPPRFFNADLGTSQLYDALSLGITGNSTLFMEVNDVTDLWPSVVSIDPLTGPDNWQHVAFVFHETLGTLYLNGTLVGFLKVPGPPAGVVRVTVGGTGNGNRDFDGWIDEVTLFHRDLDAAEVADLAANPGRVSRIIAFGTVPGDANGDGCVSGADYTIWADHFDTASGGPFRTWRQGDWTRDGRVTGADYSVWADHFGDGCPTTTIPEPSTAALGWVLGVILGCALTRFERSGIARSVALTKHDALGLCNRE